MTRSSGGYVGNRPLSYTDPTGLSAADGNGGSQGGGFGGFQKNDGSPGTFKWWGEVFDDIGEFFSLGSGRTPPPASALPGISAQNGVAMCGPGTFSPTCGGSVLYAGAPRADSLNGVTSSPVGGAGLGQALTEALVPGAAYYNLGHAADSQGRYLAAVGWYAAGHLEIVGTVVTAGMAGVIIGATRGATVAAKSLGANPFKGKTAKEIAEMLEKKGYVPRGPDPAAGRGTYVNPNTGRGYHIDASHLPPKGPHVGVHRPRDMRDTLPPRDYPLEGP